MFKITESENFFMKMLTDKIVFVRTLDVNFTRYYEMINPS